MLDFPIDNNQGAPPSHYEMFFDISQNFSKNFIPLKNEIAFFPGTLTPSEKIGLSSGFIDDHTLAILFQKYPEIAFTIRQQDLFLSGAQVIVNAANIRLEGGGGIDGAIHKNGGDEYARAHHELQTLYQGKYIEGHAAMISSGALKATHKIDNVIVVAGPRGPDINPDKEQALYSCYFNALALAAEQGKASIAFPSISTGIFQFPKNRAIAIALKAVKDFLDAYPETTLKTISIHHSPNGPIADLELYLNELKG